MQNYHNKFFDDGNDPVKKILVMNEIEQTTGEKMFYSEQEAWFK